MKKTRKNGGQGLVEYVLLIALVGMVVVGGLALTGKNTADVYKKLGFGLSGEGVETPSATELPETVQVSVRRDTGQMLAAVEVSAFNANEELVGSAETDSFGLATFTELYAGRYVFRASYDGQAYWSDTITVPKAAQASIVITGREISVHVMDARGQNLADVPVYAFNQDGGYIGERGSTDQSGMFTFALTDGSYKFRADYQAQEAWSEVIDTTQRTSVEIRVPSAPFTVRVYRHDGQAVADVPVYAFNENDGYTGVSARTGADGSAVLELANGRYHFRVDYEGDAYWSETITTPEMNATTIQVGGVDVTVRVTDNNGNPIPNKAVYIHNGDGDYLGIGKSSDANGTVVFELKEGIYRFRTIDAGQDFWSDSISVPDERSATIRVERKGVGITVVDKRNNPLSGVRLYVFSYRRSGHSTYYAYLGLSAYTDLNGQAYFDLNDGEYIIYVDAPEKDYDDWSKPFQLPAQDTITIRLSKGD